MKNVKKVISVLILTIVMATSIFIGSGLFMNEVHAASILECTTDSSWTNLWVNYSGWTGSDGIYSIPLNGKDAIGSATSTTKTMWNFSDTYIGTCNTQTHQYISGPTMINHSIANLTGNSATPANRIFKYGLRGDMTTSNIFGTAYWLMDGIAIGSYVYVLAYTVDAQMYPTRIDMIKIPIVNGAPDLANYTITQNVPLMYKDSGHQIVFGIGICDNTTTAGAPNPDGYVYIYGYRDDLATHVKELVVARVARADFADTSKWRYYNNGSWLEGVTQTNNAWAVRASHVSCELSVTPLNSGLYNNKFVLVFEKDVFGNELQYAIGDNPYTFGTPVTFYTPPEPSQIPNSYTYNAKAHPHLSPAGYLLVSYNVNLTSGFPTTNDIYRPRFVKLNLNKFAQ